MNDAQIEYWNGPAGQRWVDQQELLSRAFVPYTKAVVERAGAKAREHVLDVGCGCGATSIELAQRVTPAGAVVGVDVSAPMLARARERGAGLTQLRFIDADAATFVTTPPTAAFDLIFSRFGVMFFADPAAAFSHLRVQLRDSGRLTFVCWRAFEDNAWARVPLEAVRSVLTEPPPTLIDDRPGPYAFSDRAKIEHVLRGAGFQNIAIDRFDAPVTLSGTRGSIAAAVEFALSSGPASRLLAESGAPKDVRTRAADALARQLEAHRSDDGYALAGSCWLVSARA
jgi:SAM-dependent methyltransferase